MISVEEAKRRLKSSLKKPVSVQRKVTDSCGYVLAEDIKTTVNLPLFDQSAVDGYAICCSGSVEGEILFSLQDEVKAGDSPIGRMKNNSAVRIFTGAAVPSNAMCVVMQENVTLKDGKIAVSSKYIQENANIRREGNQLKKGTTALNKGILLTPAAIGFLCSIGRTKVKVFKRPITGVLVTGNELISPGNKIKPGQIYESNLEMLCSALQQNGYEVSIKKRSRDTKAQVLQSLQKVMSDSDVAIISGGISVGKYDFVKEVMKELGVKELFYKVSQKPGKPFFVGWKGAKLIFAVPGNPAAALVCMYQYILPSLNAMSGQTLQGKESSRLKSLQAFQGKGERSLFLKANIQDDVVSILDGQDSDNLQSFARANALVYLPADHIQIREGEHVDVFTLPVN
ncbi:MAG TPA: molybdopterin molybdotransferase MoeA [Bacteroidia bacterium]|nr:molybdopterin molybdotransferase MoeA [Bacteroidia bacterium]HNP97931.1 molybdopterin molybdotransferase MoeA [Bacteroidia bacterium]